MTFITAFLLWLNRELFGSGEWHTCEHCGHDCNLPLHKSNDNPKQLRLWDKKICDECAWEEYGHKHNVAWAAKRPSHR